MSTTPKIERIIDHTGPWEIHLTFEENTSKFEDHDYNLRLYLHHGEKGLVDFQRIEVKKPEEKETPLDNIDGVEKPEDMIERQVKTAIEAYKHHVTENGDKILEDFEEKEQKAEDKLPEIKNKSSGLTNYLVSATEFTDEEALEEHKSETSEEDEQTQHKLLTFHKDQYERTFLANPNAVDELKTEKMRESDDITLDTVDYGTLGSSLKVMKRLSRLDNEERKDTLPNFFVAMSTQIQDKDEDDELIESLNEAVEELEEELGENEEA